MLCDWLAVVAVAWVAAPQETSIPNAAPTSLLDELIEKSKGIRAFRATFVMQTSDEPKPVTLRCDYRVPHSVRVVIETETATISNWYVDRVYVMRTTPSPGSGPGEDPHARVDLGDLEALIASVERPLEREFGEPAKGWCPRAAIMMNWSIDAKSGEGIFEFTAGDSECPSPLGWLATLREKHAEPTLDGEMLRFTTDDGHFDVAISRSDGFLREFVGRGKKTFTVHLDSVVFEPEEEPEAFALPSDPIDGEDVSAACRSRSEQGFISDQRCEVYRVVTSAAGDTAWNEDLRRKVVEVLRPLDDWMVHAVHDAWLAYLRTWIADQAAQLRQFKSDGLATTQMDEWRALAKKKLDDSLAKAKQGSLDQVVVPKGSESPERAEHLLSIEREVMAQRFDALVRDPLFAEFAKATGTAQK
jgi:hypothetical protein